MRRVRELAAGIPGLGISVLVVALGLVLLGAPSATAGGPTSVLVVSPESAQGAGLYYSEKEYGELERLLGPPGGGTGEEPPGLAVGSGRQINVTWMLHDVSPWRVDRVYLDSPRGKDVWIHTATQVPESMNGYWHKAEQPSEVRALFKKLDVLGEPSGDGAGAIYPAPWEQTGDAASAAPAAPAEPPRATATATADDGTDWWWAIPGLATGAVLALVVRPFVVRLRGVPGVLGVSGVLGVLSLGRWREREKGPRQELRDL
ncbi:hypothetical protein [Streptomyces sp. 2A115]|uniref:hypothetical protein n=1 Tax=Streptomyces sp. 2A115 TaxID=3457439 RepID=UPI003FCFFA7E